jgi:hypothetical protein
MMSFRKDIGAAGVGFSLAVFGTHMWMFQSYSSSHPTTPIPDRGFVHSLNNHGHHVYLTDTEATGLALLWLAFLVGILFVGSIAIGLTSAERVATVRSSTIIACSVSIFIAAIYLWGSSMAAFAVSHGIILNFWR